LPEILKLRPSLTPEIPVYASVPLDGTEQVTAGIADAISIGLNGEPAVIIDWKSDVKPSRLIVDHYRAQVRAYLELSGAPLGLIVMMTTGEVIQVVGPN
jgi:exodeoxyribonuclease-5